jgi:ribosome-binding factor A
MQSRKQLQFSENIKRSLSLIIREINQFDSINISIIKVVTSSDLKLCKVYFRSLSDYIGQKVELNYKDLQDLLNANAKQISFNLGKAIHLRVVPTLRFYHDNTIEYLDIIN